MTDLRQRIFIIVALLTLIVGAAAAARRLARPQASMQRKADALDRFCRATRMGHDTILRSLEQPVSERNVSSSEVVADMVERDIAHFGRTSVEACLNGDTPAPIDGLTLCRIDKDYGCIARQVKLYRDALVSAGY